MWLDDPTIESFPDGAHGFFFFLFGFHVSAVQSVFLIVLKILSTFLASLTWMNVSAGSVGTVCSFISICISTCLI